MPRILCLTQLFHGQVTSSLGNTFFTRWRPPIHSSQLPSLPISSYHCPPYDCFRVSYTSLDQPCVEHLKRHFKSLSPFLFTLQFLLSWPAKLTSCLTLIAQVPWSKCPMSWETAADMLAFQKDVKPVFDDILDLCRCGTHLLHTTDNETRWYKKVAYSFSNIRSEQYQLDHLHPCL